MFDRETRVLGMEAAPIECRYPRHGWVEQDAEQIWRAQQATARGVLARTGVAADRLAAVGITNQRETTIVV